MSLKDIDYSLYLVTGRDLLPPGKDYYASLEESLQGGVTVVQIREKTAETGEFLHIAQKSLEVCNHYNVPLLINDRIDIALAIGARGVHLGQTDMPIALARRLLPSGSIIGVSCSNTEHVRKAREDGADYIGVSAVWGTQTKKLTTGILGVRGVGDMLKELDGSDVKVVAISGIKSTNVLRTLHGSVSSTGHALDGVAVVSDIVASPEPRLAAQKLADIVCAFKRRAPRPLYGLSYGSKYTPSGIKDKVARLLIYIKRLNPLVHQMTNFVAMTQSANVTLALGASPIMSFAPEEMENLSEVAGALLVNIGMVRDIEGMLLAGRWANIRKRPVVMDPVGLGASQYRKKATKELLDHWQASVIKGNAGELAALANSSEVQARGVDSVGAGFSDPGRFVRDLARKESEWQCSGYICLTSTGCPVLLTGPEDWVSDGTTVVRLSNGHKLLGEITGAGCVAGTCITVFCAAENKVASEQNSEDGENGKLVNGDMFVAAIGGVLALTVAAELAGEGGKANGSGTFLPALIDELYHLTPQILIERAKVEVIDI